ncbi:unnamed protein product [Periconia digitata]|uniref:Uncharacterized protein n=1 Tax=Periconia digitata TaxID=1303443 RepID=A0A9W4UH41_9PLEO|nr:unnamed protein product [Periconia digitata]
MYGFVVLRLGIMVRSSPSGRSLPLAQRQKFRAGLRKFRPLDPPKYILPPSSLQHPRSS